MNSTATLPKAPVRVTDVTLRDGSHAMRHAFTVQHVRDVVAALDGAGVDVIEVTHGDGLAGSSVQYGFSLVDELELIEAACETAQQATIAALLLPGIGTRKDLKAAAERGVKMVRVATQCTEADVSEQHFGFARELGLETVGFLMMAHLREPEFLLQQAALMQSYGAEGVYIVDSAGAMLPRDAAARVKALVDGLDIPVGFHAHNNLGVGVGNTLAALEAGATLVDGSLRGLGAGAGNAALEVLAAALERSGYPTSLELFELMDAAEYVVKPLMPFQPFPDRDAITVGYAGVYSTFLLHAKQIGAEVGVDPRDILLELGKRQAVAGQEDWILRTALELKAQAGHAETASVRSH